MSEGKVTLKSHTGNGYLLKNYKGSRELYKYLWSLSEGIQDYYDESEEELLAIRKQYHRLITHIYASTCLKSLKNKNFENRVTVPIYSGLIWAKLNRKVEVTVLKDMGIIVYRGYSYSPRGGKCREYRLNIKVFNKAHTIAHNEFFNAWDALVDNKKNQQQVNLFTGRPVKTVERHKLSINHENEVRNFMVIGGETNSLQTKLSIIYCDNECKCKDGWVKFTNWFDYKHFKKEDLVNFLKEYYGDKFDEKSLIMGSRLTY